MSNAKKSSKNKHFIDSMVITTRKAQKTLNYQGVEIIQG